MELSNRVKSITPSGIRKMFALATEYPDAVNLCIGQPAFETPVSICKANYAALKEGKTKYGNNAGELPLREVLAHKLTAENGIPSSPDKVMVTVGAGEALFLTFQAILDIGDEIIVPDPYFPNYEGYAHLAGAKLVPVPTYEENGFHITAQEMQKKITPKTKAILINSPCNPTGAMLDLEDLKEIKRVAEEHDLTIISDEPYEYITYDGKKHISIGSLPDMEDRVITVNSFSKSYAMTGWRVGYLNGPEYLIKKLTFLQENVVSCVNVAAQLACVDAINHCKNDIAEMAAEYTKRRNLLIDGLNQMDNISCIKSEGTFYAFANIKALGKTSVEIAESMAHEAKVLATPGSAFGAAGEGFLRFSFASDEGTLEEGLERMQQYFTGAI